MGAKYYREVATVRFFGFFRLLFRWEGSMYKLLWKDFAFFCSAYYTIALIYNHIMSRRYQIYFESWCYYCDKYMMLIQASWVIGVYVRLAVDRFYDQLNNIPFLTEFAMYVSALIRGKTVEACIIKRTIMRYMYLSSIILFTSISPTIKRRFPTLQHMTNAGLMNEVEQAMLADVETSENKLFVPLVWTVNLIVKARNRGMIQSEENKAFLIEEVDKLREKLMVLFRYDWVPIPILYTQVVTLCVYTYLFAALFGRQRLLSDPTELYVPIFTFIQFFIYMGWLKVGEEMMCPFGDDDDDFDTNHYCDNALRTALMIVDEIEYIAPSETKDSYWADMVKMLDIPDEIDNSYSADPFDSTTRKNDEQGEAKGLVSMTSRVSMIFENPLDIIQQLERQAIDSFSSTDEYETSSRPMSSIESIDETQKNSNNLEERQAAAEVIADITEGEVGGISNDVTVHYLPEENIGQDHDIQIRSASTTGTGENDHITLPPGERETD